METLLAERLVRDLNARFEGSAPEEIVRWTLEESGLGRIAIVLPTCPETKAHVQLCVEPDIPFGVEVCARLGRKPRAPRLPTGSKQSGSRGQDFPRDWGDLCRMGKPTERRRCTACWPRTGRAMRRCVSCGSALPKVT